MKLATQPFHSSVRTAISKNRDPQTGEEKQLLNTSQLEMAWECGELRIRCRSSSVTLDGDRTERVGRQPRRE